MIFKAISWISNLIWCQDKNFHISSTNFNNSQNKFLNYWVSSLGNGNGKWESLAQNPLSHSKVYIFCRVSKIEMFFEVNGFQLSENLEINSNKQYHDKLYVFQIKEIRTFEFCSLSLY